ncbi:MAG: hypothetical protein JWO36_2507 [Myxococcales bacterium]|nr:hypothetical protein [Myxococcales bacterium]
MVRLFVVLAIVLGSTVANSSPRVVVADHDPQLRRAVEETLRPWHIDVVIDDAAPAGVDEARLRADDEQAQFVVWREADQLLVYNRVDDHTESRTTPAGALDPLDAAAAALTIKTAMRLSPLVVEVRTPPPEIPVAVEPGSAVRLELGIGADQRMGARYGGSVSVRPWRERKLLVGATADLRNATSLQTGDFRGSFDRDSLLVLASWSVTSGVIEVAPYVAAGITRATLDGNELTIQRHAIHELATVRGGGTIHFKLDRWIIGAEIGVEALFGNRAYAAAGTMATLYTIPAAALVLGVGVGVDLL